MKEKKNYFHSRENDTLCEYLPNNWARNNSSFVISRPLKPLSIIQPVVFSTYLRAFVFNVICQFLTKLFVRSISHCNSYICTVSLFYQRAHVLKDKFESKIIFNVLLCVSAHMKIKFCELAYR